MTLKRALDRLEGLTPAARATEETRNLLPRALEIALRDAPGAAEGVRSTAEWAALIAPFPVHFGPAQLQAERERRLERFGPVLAPYPGALSLFLAALTVL